jgi:DNA adenine methylase
VAAAVLLNKPRSPLECINDLDGEVVNYFQVLRDYPDELIRVIELTPFAKKEWALSNQPTPDPVEAARRFYVRAYMNIAGPTATWRQGWRRQKTYTRKNGRAGMIAAAESFAKTDHLYDIANRLRGVTIENDDAFKIFERYDNPQACFYVDPPYPTSTRSSGAANTYAHEMTDDEHGRLSDTLHNLAGHVTVKPGPIATQSRRPLNQSGSPHPHGTPSTAPHNWTSLKRKPNHEQEKSPRQMASPH